MVASEPVYFTARPRPGSDSLSDELDVGWMMHDDFSGSTRGSVMLRILPNPPVNRLTSASVPTASLASSLEMYGHGPTEPMASMARLPSQAMPTPMATTATRTRPSTTRMAIRQPRPDFLGGSG